MGGFTPLDNMINNNIICIIFQCSEYVVEAKSKRCCSDLVIDWNEWQVGGFIGNPTLYLTG